MKLYDRIWNDAAREYANAVGEERFQIVVVERYCNGTWIAFDKNWVEVKRGQS